MRKLLPIGSAIVPLLVTAAAFKWMPTDGLTGPLVIISFLLGWIGMGFSSVSKRWLKVLILVAYPLLMFPAVIVIIIAVYGIPGLD